MDYSLEDSILEIWKIESEIQERQSRIEVLSKRVEEIRQETVKVK